MDKWQATTELLDRGRVERFKVLKGGSQITYLEVLELWQANVSFRSFFVDLLVKSEFSAFRWETPPIQTANANRDFEFVLVNSESLERPVDSNAFSQFFNPTNGSDVVSFSNLSGDATLVVPCPAGKDSIYGHLASFVRGASEWQIHDLWQLVGATMHAQLNDEPIWLSTAGMGVPWLHIRLDCRPKYYSFLPYKNPQ